MMTQRCLAKNKVSMLCHRQRGMALLTVLFILVLLSTLAVYTAEDENIAIRRAQNQRDAEQSRQVALAGEQWVMSALKRDLLSAPQGVDYAGDEWALLQSESVQIEDGQMAVQAQDENGKFNLNNLMQRKKIQSTATTTPMLVLAPWYKYFTRLLRNVGLDEELADAVVDWVDTDDVRTEPDGAEDATYDTAEPPYLSANQPFSSIAELTLVAGFGEAQVAALAPYVTALPVSSAPVQPGKTPKQPVFTRINVNTAPALVLLSLDETPIDGVLLTNVLQSRQLTPYSETSALYRDLFIGLDANEFAQLVDVKSDYFVAQSCARFGRVDYAQQSLLKRDAAAQEVFVLSRQRRYNCGVIATP